MINGDFKNLIDRYEKLDWNSLLRKDLGNYSLEEVEVIFNRIKLILDGILKNPILQDLSQSFQNGIQNQLNSFLNFTNQVLNNFQSTNERQHWIEQVKNKEFEIQENLIKYYNYFSIIDPNRDAEFKKYTKSAEEKVNELEDKMKMVDNLLEGAKKKATKGEIIEYGNFFGKTAEENEKASKRYFWLMIGSILLTFVISLSFLSGAKFSDNENLNFFEKIIKAITEQNLLIKIVFVSLSGYLIAHFSKVYSAEKHLYNLNIHRQNALESHKQMIDSVLSTKSENEKEIRNAMLLELTKAIFECRDSGYLKNGSNPIAPTSQVVEITKTLSGK